MAKKNALQLALKKANDAKARLDKHNADIERHKNDIERIKGLIVKDTMLAEVSAANEMFSEFGLEGDEIRLGALLHAAEYINASEDSNKALDEFYLKGKNYLENMTDDRDE